MIPPDRRALLHRIAITDRRLCGGIEQMLQICEELAAQGVTAIMLREKDLPARELYKLAAPLREITRRNGQLFIVNDVVSIGHDVDADGAHLGEKAVSVEEARRILGPNRLIGKSCHSREGLLAAQADGADYALLSPIFPTISKSSPGIELGVDGFRELIDGLTIPVVALGGITVANEHLALEAGAVGTAGIGRYFGNGNS
ncbi:thiamine phosphate synthase [soil metagenome]